MGNNKNNKE